MPDHAARPTAEALLDHAHWLGALARRLVGDPELAQDLVQDTWVRAIERPPPGRGQADRTGESSSLRGWLARVLVNRAREVRRSDGARRAREAQVVREEDSPSTAELIERAQGQRLLVAALLELDEPYRGVLLRRFFQGESAVAIAAREGVPDSTVRNQLRRGLELLRVRLEQRDKNWLPALLPLARVDGEPSAVAVGSGLGTMTSGAIAAMKLSTGIGLSAVIAAALMITLLLHDDGDPDQVEAQPERGSQIADTEEATPASVEPREGTVSRTALVARAADEPAAAPDASTAPPVPSVHEGDGCLTVTARRAGAPLEGASALVIESDEAFLPRDLGDANVELIRLQLDPAGQAHLCALEAGRHLVGLEIAPGQVFSKRVEILDDQGAVAEFELAGGGLFGEIRAATGEPVEGARVQVSHIADRAVIVVWSDSLGAYSVEGLQAGSYWFSVDFDGDPWGPSEHMSRLALEEDELRRMDIGRPEGLATVSGVLRDRAGNPVEGRGRSQPTLHVERIDVQDYRPVQVGEAGRFDTPLEAGSYSIHASVNGHIDRLLVAQRLDIDLADVDRDLVVPGTTIRGRVLGSASDSEMGVRAHRPGETSPSSFHRTVVDGSGEFALHGLGPGAWRVGPFGAKLVEFVDVEVRAEDLELRLDLELP